MSDHDALGACLFDDAQNRTLISDKKSVTTALTMRTTDASLTSHELN